MVITCEKCGTGFNLDEKALKPSGSKVRCSVCKHTWSVFPITTDAKHDADAAEHAPEESPAPGVVATMPETVPEDVSDLPEEVLNQDEEDLSRFDPDNIQMPDFDMESDDDDEIDDFDFSDIENLLEIDSELMDEDLIPADEADEEITIGENDEGDDEEITIDFSDIEDIIHNDAEDETELSIENYSSGIIPEEPESELELDLPELEMTPESDYGKKALAAIHIPSIPFLKPPEAPSEVDPPQTQLVSEETQPVSSDMPILQEEIVEPEDQGTDLGMDLGIYTEPLGKEASAEPIVKAEVPPSSEDALMEMEEVETTPAPEPPDRPEKPEPEAKTQPDEDHGIKIDTDEAPLPQEKKRTNPIIIVALIITLIVGGAYGVLTLMGIDVTKMKLSEITSSFQGMFGSETAKKKEYRVNPVKGTINGKFINNNKAGSLFVITGDIKNDSVKPVSNIRVKGTLLSQNQKPMEQVLSCGNSITDIELTSLEPAVIQKRLAHTSMGSGEVKAGGSIQFMIVFSNLPKNLQNFTVEVVGFDKKTD